MTYTAVLPGRPAKTPHRIARCRPMRTSRPASPSPSPSPIAAIAAAADAPPSISSDTLAMRKALQDDLAELLAASSRKWGFDFARGEPIPDNDAGIVWTATAAACQHHHH